jgi:DNA-binding transcriptional ArsR family regulator
MPDRPLQSFLRIAQAISDPQRIRILMLLQGNQLCVCQIVEVLQLATSTVSKHLSILRSAGVINFRKQGRWAFYFLEEGDGSPTARRLLAGMRTDVEADETVTEDRKALSLVLKVDPEVLCRRLRKN